MQRYSSLVIEILYLEENDIITSSTGTFNEQDGEYIIKDFNWEE